MLLLWDIVRITAALFAAESDHMRRQVPVRRLVGIGVGVGAGVGVIVVL